MDAANAPPWEMTTKTEAKDITDEVHRGNTIKETTKHIDKLEVAVDVDFFVRYRKLPRLVDFIRTDEDPVLPLIFRLPIEPDANRYFFTPRVVSIGPYYHGKSCLAKMDRHKSRFLEEFLSHYTSRSLEHYQNELKNRLVKQSFKDEYYDEDNLTRDELVDIMILDGCFILEFLIKIYNHIPDEIFQDETLLQYIKTDLLMFENQIPLFVLEMLYEDPIPTIEELLGYYFWGTKDDPSMYEKHLNPCSLSLLQYYNNLFIFPRSDDGKAKRVYSQGNYGEQFGKDTRPVTCYLLGLSQAPSAQQLEKAGVVIRAKRSTNFLDITFHEGVLEMPILSIDEPFVLFFVNLLMFDLHVDYHYVMESYCRFMACLTKTSNDVAILRKHGILEGKFITDEDWIHLMHWIGQPDHLLPKWHYFANLFDDLLLFCNRPKKKHVLRRFVSCCYGSCSL
ncbi:hypothetical protein LUZ62_015066 [Rhynchospora pubera]|uniref:Uncharacterized protein n=1 Tax=Rhynchospora pubera TaxID=906938 RepID=A0AAV8GFR5_9POAL|nr:hypothetical protein LUZ62_015066 [Rhynchospora pubera]